MMGGSGTACSRHGGRVCTTSPEGGSSKVPMGDGDGSNRATVHPEPHCWHGWEGMAISGDSLSQGLRDCSLMESSGGQHMVGKGSSQPTRPWDQVSCHGQRPTPQWRCNQEAKGLIIPSEVAVLHSASQPPHRWAVKGRDSESRGGDFTACSIRGLKKHFMTWSASQRLGSS